MTAVALAETPRPRTPLEESLPRLESLVSPYVGIVRNVYEHMYDVDSVRCHEVGAQAAASEEVLGTPCNEVNGGSAFSSSAARASAIGETVERYCASYVPHHALHLARAQDLDDATPDPMRFALFADEQYEDRRLGFERFDQGTVVRWTRGFRLRDGAPAHLPAQLVYLNAPPVDGEALIGYATSNGLACGPTAEEAVVGGLLELIERDAFMITWTNALALPRLDARADPATRRVLDRHFDSSGLRYELIDLSGFLQVPVVLAVVLNEHSGDGSLAVGAAAAADPGTAAVKALMEAFQTRTWARSEQRARPPMPDDVSFDESIVTFDDHVRFYADERRRPLAQFLWSSDELRPITDVPRLAGEHPLEHIHSMLDRLAVHDITAYAVDVTSPDVEQAGLKVMKVVAPELQALDAGYVERFLGGTRLREAAFALGLVQRPLDVATFNHDPHPFP